jgi:hypothetical protein
MVLGIGLYIFLLAYRSYVKLIPGWKKLMVSFGFFVVASIFTVFEGFVWTSLFNFFEHLSYTISALFLTYWCYQFSGIKRRGLNL